MDRRAWVYIFRCEQFYKIGVTVRDVAGRLSTLQIGNPFPVELVHSIPTDSPYGAEKFFHLKFADKRVRNEWFELSGQDVDWLLRIKTISQAYLSRIDLSQSKPPARDTVKTRLCDRCEKEFKYDSKSANRKYCTELCAQQAAIARYLNKRGPTVSVHKPRHTIPQHTKWTNCVVCNRALPRGFGPCCSKDCVDAYRQNVGW